MKRFLLLLLFLAPLANATDPRLFQFDVDDTTYVCPTICANDLSSSALACGDTPRKVDKLVTTSGSSSTTVTSVNTDDPFIGVAVGSVLYLPNFDTTSLARLPDALRRVTAVASNNSITVSSAVMIPAVGRGFVWWKTLPSTGAAADGWFAFPANGDGELFISFDQISATGGVDYKVEGRQCIGDYCTVAEILAGPTNIATATVVSERVAFDKEFVDHIRACFKIGTSDDDGVLVAANTDDLDWNEYVNSYSTGDGADIDFVEDAGGTPKVCVADDIAVPDPDTGAAWCTAIAAAMNGAACTPDNTYSCAYSTTTHKFTIARATGTKSIDLLWNTGTNTLTSIGPEIGFPISGDSTGATTYAGAATGETTFTANMDAGTYSGTSACVEVAAEMNATSSVVATYACSYSADTDAITISATGITQLMLLWNTGTNTATSAGPQLGFPTDADSTGALTYTGTELDSFAAAEVEKISVTTKPGR